MDWTLQDDGRGGWRVLDDAGREVACVVTHDEDGEEVRTEGEAFLLARALAATPQMRSCLERLVNLAHGASMGYPAVTPELLDAAAERGSETLRSARGLPPREEKHLAAERAARAQQRAAAAASRAA